MATHISIVVPVTLLVYVCGTKVSPPEDMMCPKGCHCYYVKTNWQTDCSESNMTTLPLDTLDPNVYTLIMNMNHLEKIYQFPPNIKVKSIQLSHNYLTTIQKETFLGLQYLLDINLSSNLINYVHPEAFIENAYFTTLQLQNNPLKPVEGSFLYSKTLRFLYLSNCQLTSLSHKFFANINGLIKVDLSGNPLHSIEAGVFDHFATLKRLILNNINLTQIDAQNHNILDLPKDGPKSDVHWTLIVGKLLSLDHLELKRSGLSNLPENIFSNYIYLRHLVLAENQLSDSDMDTTLGQNLVNIDYLDLSYCNLKAPLSKYAFAKAKRLRTLVLSGNYLSTSGLGEALSPLSKLAKLSISNCSLTELPANTFDNLTSLRELDISMNPLDKLFSSTLSIRLNHLESLEHLNMSFTGMEVVDGITTVSKLTRLRTLILSGNKIKSFGSGFLNYLPNLILLELNNCGLVDLDGTLFHRTSGHPALEELRLSRNPLLKLYGNYFHAFLPKLKTLDMSYCNLSLYSYFQEYAPSLNRLLLNNNRMKGMLDFDYFYYKGIYEHLDLSYNTFYYLSFYDDLYSDNFAEGSNITSLKLTGNPWACHCSLISAWKWAKQGLVGSTYNTASNKDTNNLLCFFNFDYTSSAEAWQANEPRPEVRPQELYTWARYVSEYESVCFCLLHYEPKSACRFGWELPVSEKIK